MKSLFSFFFLLTVLCASAQDNSDSKAIELDSNSIEHFDKFPMFPGGLNAYQEYLLENVVYPTEAQINNIQGTVYLTVILTETGEIEEVTILKDIGGGCGQEAKRVVESMPKWEPGVLNGKPVRVKTNVRIKFTLREGSEGERRIAAEDSPPQFPEGDEGLNRYIEKNLVLPEVVNANKIDDYALVSFFVDPSGLVKSPRLLKGVYKCKECGKIALELIRNMPRWYPGVSYGRYQTMEPALKIWFSYRSSGSEPTGEKSTFQALADSSGIYEIVDKYPVFPGGQNEYDSFLVRYIKYPEEALEKGIEGTVYVSVVISDSGEVTNVKVLKDIGGGCGAEAKRVVEAMPRWVPGSHEGKPVKVRIPVKVKFTSAMHPAASEKEEK